MLPIREYIVNNIKKLPGVRVLKKVPLLKRINQNSYQRYLDKRREKVQQFGYEIIACFSEIRKQLSMDLWIDWGTLLGLYRDGKIIEYDYDLDMACWRLEKNDYLRLKTALEEKGFHLVRQFIWDTDILTETYQYKEVLVDIEYYIKEGDRAQTFSFDFDDRTKLTQTLQRQEIQGMNLYLYEFEGVELIEMQFVNGISCQAPKYMEKRIIEEYGVNWNTPDKDHDWKELHNYKELGFHNNVSGWRES